MFIRLIVLLVMLSWHLSNAVGTGDATGNLPIVNDVMNYKTIFDKKFIVINGVKTSLYDIYGDIQPNFSNFKSDSEFVKLITNVEDDMKISEAKPNVGIACKGGVYVQRQFPMTFAASPLVVDQWNKESRTDTPTEIANRVAINNRPEQNFAIMIAGDVRTGKSTTLSKIHYELQKLHPTSWIIRVDFSYFQPSSSTHRMTLREIIENYMGTRYLPLLHNLISTNPKKIILLFDDIQWPIKDDVQGIISTLNIAIKIGIKVVLTGGIHTIEVLQKQINMIEIFKLIDMNIVETKNFLRRVWMDNALSHITTFLPSTTITTDVIESRVLHYTELFVHALFKTDLMRQPGFLIVLAEKFNRLSPTGCLDYTLSTLSSPTISLAAIENIHLDIDDLYSTIVRDFNHPADNLDMYYKILAFAQVMQRDEFQSFTYDFLETIKDSILTAQRQIITEKHFATFINHFHDSNIQFIHPHFQEFYAAKFIVNMIFSNSNEWWKILPKLLSSTTCHNVLAFINWQLKNEDSTTLPQFRSVDEFPIMNNLISSRFETLIMHVYNSIRSNNEKNVLKSYLLYERQDISKPKLTFGLKQTTEEHPDPNPFQLLNDRSIKRTPMELIVEFDMLQVCKILVASKIWFNNDMIQYENYYYPLLLSVIEKTTINLELVKFLFEHNPVIVPQKDLNNFLFHIIANVGDGCQPVADYLLKLGAIIETNREFLHSAIKWNNVNILRYVVENLHIRSIETTDEWGRNIFDVALDANPSPFYTFDGWWEMMFYLVENFGPLLRVSDTPVRFEALPVTHQESESPWFKLMVYGDSLKLSDLYTDSYEERHKLIIVQYKKLKRFVPATSWNLEPRILSLRRKALLAELSHEGIVHISPFQIIVHYRGINTLSPLLHQYYRSTMNKLLQFDANAFLMPQIKFVVMTLSDNIIDIEDTQYFEFILQNDRINRMIQENSFNIKEILISKLSNKLNIVHNEPETPLRVTGTIERLLETSSDVNQVITNQEIRLVLLRIIERLVKSSSSSSSYNIHASLCLTHRTQRNIFHPTMCHISWNDVDNFNDNIEQRNVMKIHVNSKKFLQSLAVDQYRNKIKVQQLMCLARELIDSRDNVDIIMGESKMIVRELLNYDSLSAWRQWQRQRDIIHSIKSINLRSLQSQTIFHYAASILPLIRGLYVTISQCIQQYNNNNTNCWYSSGILASSAALSSIGLTTYKFLPWAINGFSSVAIEFLSTPGTKLLRENIKIIRHLGLKFGGSVLGIGLPIIGMGFDLYNIVVMSKFINKCTKDVGCMIKDKIDAIISLSFSCTSFIVAGGLIISGVGLIPGLLIAMSLFVTEEFTRGMNEIVYYSNNYNTDFYENFRIFWHKIAFQPPPADVQALVHRNEWINIVDKYAKKLLQISNINIVAYGIGLGVFDGNIIKSSYGTINMRDDNVTNTHGLSRVLPSATNDTILLCLPKRNTHEVYEKYANTVTDAIYKCNNAFLIGNKERWLKRNNSDNELYIIYNLQYINAGEIIGSNEMNNIFYIHNGTTELDVIGGSSMNRFSMQSDSFRGNIQLGQSRINILDVSAVNLSKLHFNWYSQLNVGHMYINGDEKMFFKLTTQTMKSNYLQIIGRTEEKDTVICDYAKNQYSDNKLSLMVNGAGGKSLNNMDGIFDCECSLVESFTMIIGSINLNTMYTTYLQLTPIFTKMSNTTVLAMIDPLQSKFIVHFNNFPIFRAIQSLKYSLSKKTLIWTIYWRETLLLNLTILSYHSTYYKENIAADIYNETANCVFIDDNYQSTIYPIITIDNTTDDIVDIRQFNVFATVDSNNLYDVYDRYNNISNYYKWEFTIATKLTHRETGQNFIFGTNSIDRFYIDDNTTFVFGSDGHDFYMLNRESRNNILIENEANDDALDTLVIPDSCELLYTMDSLSSDCCDSSEFNVTLTCEILAETEPYFINVIIRGYLLESRHRHLQIHWHDAMYIIILPDWMRIAAENSSNNSTLKYIAELALLFSFEPTWQNTILTLISNDNYVVFNITNEDNPLIAYRSGVNDIILAKKYFQQDSSSFVILKNFFTDNGEISVNWKEFKIFIINNIIENTPRRILSYNDIVNLYINSSMNYLNNTNLQNEDFIMEYFVNMSISNDNTIIDHRNESHRVGVLVIAGANPMKFRAVWNLTRENSLSLCVQLTCIIIENWCDSIKNRINRIEFVQELSISPIVIENLDQLECESHDSVGVHLIEELNRRFSVAKKHWRLRSRNDESDRYRLLRCTGSILTDIITGQPMYRLFGFKSIIDQITFFRDNCYTLCTADNLYNLTIVDMHNMLQNRIDIFSLYNDRTSDDIMTIKFLSANIMQLSNLCWLNFKEYLHKYSFLSTNDDIIVPLKYDFLDYFRAKCVEKS